MLSVLRTISKELNSDKDVVLCSIIGSSGSSPRGAGAKMAVLSDGTTVGTIGGGAVELICTNQAKDALKEKKSFISSYILTKNDVQDIGMICGGNVKVYFQYLDHSDKNTAALFNELYSLVLSNKDVWLINVIADGTINRCGLYTSDSGLKYIDTEYADIILPNIKFKAVLDERENITIYTEPLSTSSKLFIFGGGHVGKALAPVLDKLFFNVIIFDNREGYLTKENTPGAKEIIIGDYNNIFDKISISEKDYVVIMTPGHQADFEVLDQTLRTEATYIGCIGSRKKDMATQMRLLENGHTMDNISRIHSPIGIEIYAETPDEIAISIAAELIKHRASLTKSI